MFVTGTSDVGLHLTVPTRKKKIQEILFVIDIKLCNKIIVTVQPKRTLFMVK